MGIITFRQYLTEAGDVTERQENAFVEAINIAVEMNGNKPITIISKDAVVKGVTGADKYKGRQASGSEPYTDVRLFTSTGVINLSMKGPSAPSLAGGGLRGVEAILPGIGVRFFRAAHEAHLKAGRKLGDKIPDTYAKLNDKDKKLLVLGNAAMGGPIDFMYIGPMDVKTSMKRDVLTVNGKLTDATKYANEHELYFRLRSRRIDQRFDPAASDTKGVPKIYGKSPSKGDSSGRLVITDQVPSSAKVITF